MARSRRREGEVAAAIKKTLASHKLGENGFKPNASGSWFNAHENHNETFKLIEDAIAQSGANVSFFLNEKKS